MQLGQAQQVQQVMQLQLACSLLTTLLLLAVALADISRVKLPVVAEVLAGIKPAQQQILR
jgi:hypothetical protein